MSRQEALAEAYRRGILPEPQRLAYEEAMKDFVEDLHSFCNSRGASFVSVCTDQPIERMLFKELLKVGIMS